MHEPAPADWWEYQRRFLLSEVARHLSDLLFWGEHPEPEPLTPEACSRIAAEVLAVLDAAVRHIGDRDAGLTGKLKHASRMAEAFADALTDPHGCLPAPVTEWTCPSYQSLYQYLRRLTDEFAAMGAEPDETVGDAE